MSEGNGYGNGLACDGSLDDLLKKTVGVWQPSPLWVLRGLMFRPSEKALIIALLDLWHTSGRPDWFYGSNANMRRLAGLPNQTLINARRRLVQKCILQTKPGKHRKLATSYHLSQEFLHTLAQEHTPLQTSTYSGVQELDGSAMRGNPSKIRRIPRG